MSDTPENESKTNSTSIDVSGNVQGQIVNIGSGNMTFREKVTMTMTNSKQHIGNSAVGAKDDKAELAALVEKLEAELAGVKESHAAQATEVAEKVEKLMADLDKEDESEIETDIIEVRTNHLKAAAENVKEIIPTVTEIAFSIVARIVQMGIF